MKQSNPPVRAAVALLFAFAAFLMLIFIAAAARGTVGTAPAKPVKAEQALADQKGTRQGPQ